MMVVVTALAGLAVAVWLRRPHPAPRPAQEAAGPAEAQALFLQGDALARAHHAVASLPLYRRALAVPGAPAEAHLGYALALHDAALEGRTRDGVLTSALRGSPERVAAAREGLVEFERAAALATRPPDVARIHAWRAHTALVWGMNWDALREFRAAQALDPQYGGIADMLAGWLHHPEQVDTTLLNATLRR